MSIHDALLYLVDRIENNHFHVDDLLLKAGSPFSLGGLEAFQSEILIKFEFINAPLGGTHALLCRRDASLIRLGDTRALPFGLNFWLARAAISGQA